PDEFGAAFKDFLRQSVAQAPAEEPFFRRRMREHFGGEPGELAVVSYDFATHDHPNLQLALDSYVTEGRSAETLGVSSQNKRFQGVGLSDLAARGSGGLWGGGPQPGPVEYVDISLDGDRTITCIQFGVALVESGEERLAVLVNAIEGPGTHSGITVQAMAPRREQAEAFLAEL